MLSIAVRAGVLVLTLLGVAACGWHLRGTAPGLGSLEGVTIAVQAPGGHEQLRREVRAALRAAGADLTDSRPGVPTVVLYQERSGTRNISGGRADAIQEYELRYEVEWALRDGQGEPLIERTQFRQFRNYRFERARVLGSEGREDSLMTELRGDVAMLLTNRLQAVLGAGRKSESTGAHGPPEAG